MANKTQESANRQTALQVETKSESYQRYQGEWRMINTLLEGEKAIKDAGTTYLPMLSGQDVTQYDNYKNRGSFYNAFARTIQGMVGAITRKPAKVDVPESMKDMTTDFTLDANPLDNVIKDVTKRILSTGYCGVLADLESPSDRSKVGRPYGSIYGAMDIYNYRYKSMDEQRKLTFLVLQEQVGQPDPTDFYKTIKIQQLRVLSLEEDILIVRLFQKLKNNNNEEGWYQIPVHGVDLDFIPRISGVPLSYIPFVFFGGEDNNPIPAKPPLIDLAYLNISHWKTSVDFYHGLHYCAIPTPWAAGFDEEKILTIGGTKAWVTKDPEASCGYLEFTGQGLNPIKEALDKIEAQMAVIGARLLEEPKKAAEAAQTLAMRVAGDTSSLSSVASNIERGFEQVLQYMALWIKAPVDSIKLEVNKDFISTKMAPDELTALIKAVQTGRISMDTFLYNLKSGEVLPDDRTIEDEKKLIIADGIDMFKEEEITEEE